MKKFLCILLFINFLGAANAASEKKSEKKEPVLKTAIFAGGCFWCMQPPYDALKEKGVVSVFVGYSGGHTESPTYEQTSAGNTGHLEVVEVTYDENLIHFRDLLPIFWKNIDPFDKSGQFCDKGDQYTSAVFYENEAERKAIDDSILDLKKKGIKTENFVTKISPKKKFYKGEDYHQSYYQKNSVRYKYYRYSCGRDKRLEAVWGKTPGL